MPCDTFWLAVQRTRVTGWRPIIVCSWGPMIMSIYVQIATLVCQIFDDSFSYRRGCISWLITSNVLALEISRCLIGAIFVQDALGHLRRLDIEHVVCISLNRFECSFVCTDICNDEWSVVVSERSVCSMHENRVCGVRGQIFVLRA